MPVQFVPTQNSLTTPPSFAAITQAIAILGYVEMAARINELNPTIPVATVQTVLEALREVTLEQLANGNNVVLGNFVSFNSAIRGRLENPTDPVAKSGLHVATKMATLFVNRLRNLASLERLPTQNKQPNVSSAYHSITSELNYVMDGEGLTITGSNIGFDPMDAEQGVYLTSPAGNEVKQSNIGLNDPSKIIVVAGLDQAGQPAGAASVEQILTMKARYTTNGSLRVSNAPKPLRTTNVIDNTNDQIFVVGDAMTGPASVTTYTGAANIACKIIAGRTPLNAYYLQIGPMTGDLGDPVTITGNAAYVLSGLAADVTCTVTDFVTLTASVMAYGRHMVEFVDLSDPNAI